MKTNLLYAFRNIQKNAVNSVITVFGLSVAIACCLIIYIYINQEYSYNSFHKNADRIYRLNYNLGFVNSLQKEVRVEPEIADLLKKEVPQIEKSAEYRTGFSQVLSYNDNYFDIQVSYASEEFFEMFSFELIAGNPHKVFANPNEIVITKKLADKIFINNKDYAGLLGKSVRFPVAFSTTPFIIIGVAKDVPKNSSINFEAIISGKSGRNFGGCDNYFGYTSVYYMVREKASAKDAETNVKRVVANYYKERVKSMQENNQLIRTSNAFVPFVLSLKDVYTEGDIQNCFESSVSKSNFSVLIIIGILILIIACSNYTILSLGQYLMKIGDVGIRKAMGATRSNIFAVFFSEGIMLTFLAFCVGILLCKLSLPVFSKLAETEIFFKLINIQNVFLFVFVLFLLIAFFTSLVPVMVFSNVSPHQMAGKKISVGNKNHLSQIFISIQYSLSIILIIVTLFIIKQSNYLKNQSLGFDSNNIINVGIGRVDNDKKPVLKKMLAEHPGVITQTLCARNFMDGESDDFINKGDGQQIDVIRFEVDQDYITTLGLKLIRGKGFTESNVNPRDRSAVVNAKFVEAFGIEDEPIGKMYNFMGVNFTIIGVVDDYYFFDCRNSIRPSLLCTRTNYGNSYNNILLRYHPKQVNSVIEHIKKCYEEIAPGKTLNYTFWNERLQQRYQTEERWSKIIGFASLIAIIISSLGLFGLTILMINQRIKEIGVRKVNGATTLEVIFVINKSFIAWLFGSMIFSFPVAFYIVNKLLENYQNKVQISWWVFVVAGVIALLVALLTVSWQSWKAASRNPVKALRYE